VAQFGMADTYKLNQSTFVTFGAEAHACGIGLEIQRAYAPPGQPD
jgi:hypothetical protein